MNNFPLSLHRVIAAFVFIATMLAIALLARGAGVPLTPPSYDAPTAYMLPTSQA